MGDPGNTAELDFSQAPAHWGLNFTKTTHTAPSESIKPSKVALPPGYTVLITGGGKGVGENIAKAFVQAKASNVIITSRTEADLVRVKSELETLAQKSEHSIRVAYEVQDATKSASYSKLRDVLQDDFEGRLDCLVTNAGPGSIDSLWTPNIEDTDHAEWDRSIAINFTAAYYAAKFLVPLMLRAPSSGKTIVNVSSSAAHCAGGNMMPASYSIGKLALNRLTQTLGENYRAQGLVVVAVHPGTVATPGALDIMPANFRSCEYLLEAAGIARMC